MRSNPLLATVFIVDEKSQESFSVQKLFISILTLHPYLIFAPLLSLEKNNFISIASETFSYRSGTV